MNREVQLEKLPNYPGPSIGCHNAVLFNNILYVVGGVHAVYDEDNVQQKFPDVKRYAVLNRLWTFNLKDRIWRDTETKGRDDFTGIENCACLVWQEKAFFFGGWTGRAHTNEMWSLDLLTYVWDRIQYSGMGPTPRAGHSMILMSPDVFLLFGGQGNEVGESNEFPLDNVVKSEKYSSDVYNNQTVLFHPNRLNTWQLLETEEKQPVPRGYHSCTVIGSNAFVYGGRNYESGALNDVWLFNMRNQCWSEIHQLRDTICVQMYRHSAIAMENSSTILFLGGWKKSGCLNDQPAIFYDLSNQKWWKAGGFGPRAGHTACIVDEKSFIICGGETNEEGKRILTSDFMFCTFR